MTLAAWFVIVGVPTAWAVGLYLGARRRRRARDRRDTETYKSIVPNPRIKRGDGGRP